MTNALRLALLMALVFGVLTPPSFAEEGETHLNVPYLEAVDYPDDKDMLDVYVPAGEGPFPALYFVHGGGLALGDKKGYGYVGEYFASKGYVTVVVNHRLSPGVAHPEHIRDIAASFAWVKRNIDDYKGDVGRIVVTGHSAGAYLAALLALDARYLAVHGLAPSDMAGVAPISGFYHVDRVAPDRSKAIWGEALSVWEDASPARHVSDAAPPTLLLYADGDEPERRQESEDLAGLLRGAGAGVVRTKMIADRTHISIVRQFGRDDDATTQAVLNFANEILTKE